MAEWLAAPLQSATARGDGDLSRKLVQAGARIGGVALHEAVQEGHAEIVDLLLENGASVDDDKDDYGTPLHVAAGGGKIEIARLLLREGADVDAIDRNDSTPLTHAIEKGHLAMAEALLAAGAGLTSRHTEFEMSALDLAATTDRDDVVRLLIEYGAEVNLAASNGCTALHFAAETNKVGAIHVLVEAGADLQAGANKPLHCAAGAGYLSDGVWPEATLALLNLGAEVNARTNLGKETALHHAASKAGRQGAVEVVRLLLRWGADETIVCTRGKTAAEWIGTRRVFTKVPGDDERVRGLLARAPADRAWRRRGLLVLCRAYPDRLRLDGDLASLAARVFDLVDFRVFRKIVLYL